MVIPKVAEETKQIQELFKDLASVPPEQWSQANEQSIALLEEGMRLKYKMVRAETRKLIMANYRKGEPSSEYRKLVKTLDIRLPYEIKVDSQDPDYVGKQVEWVSTQKAELDDGLEYIEEIVMDLKQQKDVLAETGKKLGDCENELIKKELELKQLDLEIEQDILAQREKEYKVKEDKYKRLSEDVESEKKRLGKDREEFEKRQFDLDKQWKDICDKQKELNEKEKYVREMIPQVADLVGKLPEQTRQVYEKILDQKSAELEGLKKREGMERMIYEGRIEALEFKYETKLKTKEHDLERIREERDGFKIAISNFRQSTEDMTEIFGFPKDYHTGNFIGKLSRRLLNLTTVLRQLDTKITGEVGKQNTMDRLNYGIEYLQRQNRHALGMIDDLTGEIAKIYGTDVLLARYAVQSVFSTEQKMRSVIDEQTKTKNYRGMIERLKVSKAPEELRTKRDEMIAALERCEQLDKLHANGKKYSETIKRLPPASMPQLPERKGGDAKKEEDILT